MRRVNNRLNPTAGLPNRVAFHVVALLTIAVVPVLYMLFLAVLTWTNPTACARKTLREHGQCVTYRDGQVARVESFHDRRRAQASQRHTDLLVAASTLGGAVLLGTLTGTAGHLRDRRRAAAGSAAGSRVRCVVARVRSAARTVAPPPAEPVTTTPVRVLVGAHLTRPRGDAPC